MKKKRKVREGRRKAVRLYAVEEERNLWTQDLNQIKLATVTVT